MIIRSGWNEETELLDCILMNTVAHETFYVRSVRVNTKHFEIFMIRFENDPKMYMEIARHLLRVFDKRFVYVYVDGIKISETSVELSLIFLFNKSYFIIVR